MPSRVLKSAIQKLFRIGLIVDVAIEVRNYMDDAHAVFRIIPCCGSTIVEIAVAAAENRRPTIYRQPVAEPALKERG